MRIGVSCFHNTRFSKQHAALSPLSSYNQREKYVRLAVNCLGVVVINLVGNRKSLTAVFYFILENLAWKHTTMPFRLSRWQVNCWVNNFMQSCMHACMRVRIIPSHRNFCGKIRYKEAALHESIRKDMLIIKIQDGLPGGTKKDRWKWYHVRRTK